MKRWIVGLLVIFALVLVLFNFILPASRTITSQVTVPAGETLLYRSFTSTPQLKKWWPGTTEESTKLKAAHNGYTFLIKPEPFHVVSIDINTDAQRLPGALTFITLNDDSTLVAWKVDVPGGNGPLAPLLTYFKARAVKKETAAVLARLQKFVQNDAAVYNLKITEERVTDTLLAVTRTLDSVQPSTATYYALLQRLQQYIAAQGAQETNFPMLSVRPIESKLYETMVAIPINKPIPDNGPLVFRRMIPGKILVTEVKGGPAAVEAGFAEVEQYMTEHNRNAPGRAFQSLVTNRLTEKDTLKWSTKLYYPVF